MGEAFIRLKGVIFSVALFFIIHDIILQILGGLFAKIGLEILHYS